MMDREAMFQSAKWEAPRDLRHARGLVAHVRAANRDVERRRAEWEEAHRGDVAAAPAVELSPPVPLTSSPSRPAVATPKPATKLER
jgi:hypothetical protein